jgi:hypothetical protein
MCQSSRRPPEKGANPGERVLGDLDDEIVRHLGALDPGEQLEGRVAYVYVDKGGRVVEIVKYWGGGLPRGWIHTATSTGSCGGIPGSGR